jgi:hypothetical protein
VHTRISWFDMHLISAPEKPLNFKAPVLVQNY